LIRTRAARRVALYLPAAAVAAGLVWAGWLREQPADPDTLASCADIEMRSGLFEPALRKTSEALRADPRHLHSLLIEAHCWDRLGDREASMNRYRQALALVTDADLLAEIRIALALGAMDDKRLEEARDVLSLARPAKDEVLAKVDAVGREIEGRLKSAAPSGR
jgi:Flp pilus assembly protein TadD